MNLLQLLWHKRRLRRQLRLVKGRADDAQCVLDDARQHVLTAQEDLWATRGRHAIPDTHSPTEVDLEVIAAVDHWLTVRHELEPALTEIRATWNEHTETLRSIASRRETWRAITVRTARVLLPKTLATADTLLAFTRQIVQSKLSNEAIRRLARRSLSPDALQRYQRNNAYLVAALENVSRQIQPEHAREIHGGLPHDIALRVESAELLQGPFVSILRRYQEFGARYLITQERTILGDEMGLGKTIQALAAMCHLHSLGARHFLVVVPNSVLINWQREISQHTSLTSVVLHGSDRDLLVRRWNTAGGVAISTYGTLPKIAHQLAPIDMFVADEAHYAKNPEAMRSLAVQHVAKNSRRVALLTGTALENRLAELQALAVLVAPELQENLSDITSASVVDPEVVATMLSPVYLRRTQTDVLKELPERVHIDEWIELSEEDLHAYLHAPPTLLQKRKATVVGNGSQSSAKYERAIEIISDHLDARRKVVVFSFFRDVLTDIARLTHSSYVINGDLTSNERQEIIDEFTYSTTPAVLISQIDAGGLGVNLQAAHAVVLMEAQLKPSTEWQAVARVHRMGQTQTVVVHRLLARDTIEEHLVQLLATKENIFYAYAHESAVKDASIMATDTKDSSIAEELQRRLVSGEAN